MPESVIMKITGHSTMEMFDRYNTVDAEDARRSIDQMQGYFASVDQNESVDQNVDQTAPTATDLPTRVGVKS